MTESKNLASRRSFIKQVSFASLFLATGKFTPLSAAELFSLRNKVKLRFVVASDSHYGQPKTEYALMMDKMIAEINQFHQISPLNFTVINGDLIHNEPAFLPQIKQKLNALTMPWHVTRGNHDMVSNAYWNDVGLTPLNHHFLDNGHAIILADTSNEKGVYLSPDLVWLKETLELYKKKKQVLLFLHIPQKKWTANGIDNPAFFELIDKYPNIKAVFHGHEHDKDGIFMHGTLPFFFDAHIGGNWGTDYKGYRVVEMMQDGTLATYMMNPTEVIEKSKYSSK